jgi:signal peptide peptidase SppA
MMSDQPTSTENGPVLTVNAEGKVWAVRPEHMGILASINEYRIDAETIQALEARSARTSSSNVQGNGVAVVPIKGVITPYMDLFAMIFGGGGATVGGIRSGVRAAVADPDVKAIVLDIDSPGGQVDGIPELAADILQARESKPIVAVANHMIGSAAYWIASQAHEIVASPSSEVGSIGVYQLHKDVSENMAAAGVKPTLISAGKYKVEGNPYEPLNPDALAAAQQAVDDFYGMFTAAVATGRSHSAAEVTSQDVQDGYGEGRTLTAKRAVKADLADRVGTLSETVSRLSGGRSRIKRTAAENDVEQMVATSGWATYSAEDRSRVMNVLAEMQLTH